MTYEIDGVEYDNCEVCLTEIIKTKAKTCVNCIGKTKPSDRVRTYVPQPQWSGFGNF